MIWKNTELIFKNQVTKLYIWGDPTYAKNCYGTCTYRDTWKRELKGCTPNHEVENEVGL